MIKQLKLVAVLTGLLFLLGSFQKDGILPTNLQVTVVDDAGNIQIGASVKLYKTEEDYKNDKNAIKAQSKTNKKGRVIFKKLDTKVYWVRAQKGDLTNDDHGIKTSKLEKGRLNRINIVLSGLSIAPIR
ncbi:carboxypeptidase regulatory-like domain-containing protein [Rapidithrix thailandica]|uniref:Carboxypeptidase regulatory-like domain-containing protein n=1 Tax=Rapidithrix thailandica TaxID=413964 RepID=A0AAW9SGS6_9BACT